MLDLDLLRRPGGAEQWRRRLASEIADRSRLVTTVERSIATLGVAHLPASELIP